MQHLREYREGFVFAGLFLLAVFAVLSLLALPLTAAIGPFYWDTIIYYDATARIADGQVPVVDFHAPVGPLGYWLFSLLHSIFPDGQGLYMASWSILLITGPAMALIVFETVGRSRALAVALAIPLLIFSALPFNVEQFYPYPGVDGYGIYNRQISQLLYVLIAGLVFLEHPTRRIAVVAACIIALFLTKITGFLVGVPLIVLGVLARRLSLGQAAIVGAIFAAVLLGLEIWSGLTQAYVTSILSLVSVNEGSLLSHVIHGAGRNITTIAGLGVLICALAWSVRKQIFQIFTKLTAASIPGKLRDVAELPIVWLCAAAIGGILLESQNWGGQAFLFVWPALVLCLMAWGHWSERTRLVIAVLTAVAMLPSYVSVGGRALRTYLAQLQYDPVEIPEIGALSSLSKRAGIDGRVALIRQSSVNHPDYYRTYINSGELPFFNYYAQPEFQLAWLQSIGEGVAAIRAFEAKHDIHFETILNLNFVNPFPYLLGRSAPRLVTIGKDPFRTLPPLEPLAMEEIEQTDLILWPKCPETVANQRIREHFGQLIGDRVAIELSPCWEGLVLPDSSKLSAVVPAKRPVFKTPL